ncbi:MAG TPA: HEAT repeat domain-containing protein [Verrucomicrobiales bacterium]|nr:HEAT repeat domain-containing protein [Verrucomicrobiales bacterium]
MKRLIIMLLAGLLAAGLVVYLLGRITPSPTPSLSSNAAESAPNEERGGNPSLLGAPSRDSNAEATQEYAVPAEDSAAAPPSNNLVSDDEVEGILLELHELAMQDDAASFERILGFLPHPSQEVRITAVIALEQYADPAAIPHLEEAAAKSQDQEFRARVAESIDFLNLPALRDLLDKDGNLILDPADANPEAE